jgi:uncharacterized protein
MRRFALPTVLFALLAPAFLAAPRVNAASLRDDGNFFSPDAEQRVAQALDEIQQRRGKNVVVETYEAPPASVQTGGDERTRNESYRQWAAQRGQSTGADLVVLVTRSPGHIQVASRQALKQSGAFTAADETAAANAMAPAFRQKNFDQGILDGLAFIDRKLAQATGPERSTGATGGGTQSRATGSGSAAYPPPPGGGSSRTPAPVPSSPSPRVGCGGGSMLCLLVAIIGGFLLIRKMMARRSGYGGGTPPGGYGAPPPPPGPYGGGYGQGGYGQGGYGRGGGFGSGLGGGLLGGLLGGWLMNRSSHGSTGGAFGGSDPNAGSHPQGLPPTDPSTFGGGGADFGGGGADFGGGGGADFGGGGDVGGGGGDSGGGGADF